MNSEITIRYLNTQHYNRDREAAFVRYLTANEPNVIMMASTGRAQSDHIHIPGYYTFQTNKANELHAGAAICIRKGQKFTAVNNFYTDTIGIKLETSQGPIMLMTGYSPPRHNFLPEQDLGYLIRHNLPALYAGDLNARSSLFGYNTGANIKGRALSRLIFRNQLQHIGPVFNTFFTRQSATKPDIVLTNNRFYLNYHIAPGGLAPTDHIPMDIKISANPIMVLCPPKPNLALINWDNYREQFQHIREINMEDKTVLDIHNALEDLYRDISAAKTAVTPYTTVNLINNIKATTKFKRLLKILEKYGERLRVQGKTEHLERVIRDTQLNLIREGNICKMDWWDTQLSKIEAATKNNYKFWKRVKGLIQKKPNVLNTDLTTRENGILTVAKTDKEKVEMFTNIWKKVYRISDQENTNFCPDTENRVKAHLARHTNKITPKWRVNLNSIRNDQTGQLPFDNDDVINTIKKIANKAPGPSKLRKPFISNLPPNIISNITHLFNSCYAVAYYPSQFKLADMVFIPKDGRTSDPTNYRPISLLNFLGKVFATLLNRKLVRHLETNNILKESQFGFRRRRCSTTLLGSLYERISREKASGRKTLVTLVLRDVRKAFDKVWHEGLLFKLMGTGIDTHLLRILASFLQHRKARVKIRNEMGDTFALSAGVPQGDVLIPTLFTVMANDFPEPTVNHQNKNFVAQYADDFTQVIITKFDNNIDMARKMIHTGRVVDEILKLNTFERQWKIQTHMDKFQIIHIGVQVMPRIVMGGKYLPHSTQGKLLGMEFSSSSFHTRQVLCNKNRAETRLRELYRFRFLNRKLKLRLYKALVLPLLQYPITPLNAISKTNLTKLQAVQNKATQWICNEYYPSRRTNVAIHTDLKLETLEERFKRLAEGVYDRLDRDNSQFWRDTIQLPMPYPHARFPSAYRHTFN